MNISAQDVINALFSPDDIVCLRVFDDRKEGIFTGAKLNVEAGKFFSVEEQLAEHNQKHRGIFFVVNSGGHTDKEITRINAQFVEMDDKSFEEQQKLIDNFSLPPSMIIKTRKSLHTYWFVQNADVSQFRPIQKALVQHFGGDPMCVNESRVMRLPNYYPCKQEPILVECISFHPERRYTQEQLMQVLPELETVSAPKHTAQPIKMGTQKGLQRIEAECLFLQHCKNDSQTLPEHDWYAMITNLFPFEGGIERIHELSRNYPKYSPQETDAKIAHFQKSGTAPMTCETIAQKGYVCPKLKNGLCSCKFPVALVYQPLSLDGIQTILANLLIKDSTIENLQTARKFIEEYLYNIDAVTANAVINYTMKDKFRFKTADLKPLIAYHKEVNKNFENEKRAKQHSQKVARIPAWYEETERGLKFLPDVLAVYLAQKAPVFYAAEQHYRYEHGVYTEISELDAKNMVREQMLTGNTKLSQISDAEGQWRMQIQRDVRELNANPYLINVRNGLYNVIENTLTEHSPQYLSTVQLNVSYVPDAKCPMFLKFLHDALSDAQVYLVQEILGYFLIPVNRAQKSFVIVGEAGAGKSLLLLVLNDILLGRENVSNVSWQSLNERFKTAELFGKLANIFADLPTKNIDDNGIFKALVGEDYLTVERKNKNPFSFQPYARLLFSCNKIPKNYGDKSEGFYRRLIIIRFSHAVPESKRDPDLLEKFRTEADGIFLFALEGLKRLMNNHYKFSVTAENLDELQKYREESNSVLSFVKDCCELDSTGEVGRSELYTRYKAYCEDAGLTPYAQRTFNAELETCCPSIQRAKDTTGKRKTWRGLKLADTD